MQNHLLSLEQKAIRKIAWGRLKFFKDILNSNFYSRESIIKQVNTYREMYKNSNLDEAGQRMATKKLDALLETHQERE